MARLFLEKKLSSVYKMRANPEAEDYDPLKADFRNFLYYALKEVLCLGEPHAIQYDIAEWMQSLPVSPDGIARGQVQAMRGCGKSVIAAVFCCWLWYCNPTIRIMMIGSTASKAEEFAGLIKSILDRSELLQHLKPNYGANMWHGKKRMKVEKNSATAFDVAEAGPSKDPSFASYGVYGGYTGSHPDVLIPDDVEIPENSLTRLARTRLLNKMREFESLVMEYGCILQMGTPQTEESVYTASEGMGYPIRRWPAELPDRKDEPSVVNCSPWILARLDAGEAPGSATYSERFPEDRLIEKKAKGEAYYRLQFLLDTRLSDEDRYPLKLRNLIVLDQDFASGPASLIWGTSTPLRIDSCGFNDDAFYGPAYVSDDYAEWQDAVMYIDPAGGGSDGVGYAIAKTLGGMVFIPAAGQLAAGKGQQGTSEAVLSKLAKIAALWGVKKVLVETNWGGDREGSAYTNLLQPIMAKINGPTQIIPQYNAGNKFVRILDDLEPLTQNHKIVISSEVAKCVELWRQYTRITRSRGCLQHDDCIEALWGATRYFLNLIKIDPEEEAAKKAVAEGKRAADEFVRDYTRSKGGISFGDDRLTKRNNKSKSTLGRGRRWRL